MTIRNHSAVCDHYRTIWNSMPDAPNDIRHCVASSMCHQASKLKLPKTFSASEIIAAVSIKQSQVQDDSSKSTTKGVGTSMGNPPVSDKIPPQSKMEDKKSYVQRLLRLGLSQQAAEDAADQIYGQYDKAISGKTKKAIVAKLEKEYGNRLSKESRELIATNAVREAQQKVAIENSKRGFSPLQANSQHIRAASSEVPSWAAVNTDIYGDSLPDLLPSESHFRNAADETKHAEYMENIHENISDIMRERALRRYQDRQVRSAKLREKEDSDSKVPKWARSLGWD